MAVLQIPLADTSHSGYGESVTESFTTSSQQIPLTATGAGNPTQAFMWFSLDVPPGAKINSARLNMVWANNWGLVLDGQTAIHVADVDNIAPPTSYQELQAVPRSLSPIIWDYRYPFPRDGDPAITPDFSSLVQDVVDRPGWQAENSLLVLIWEGDGDRLTVQSDEIVLSVEWAIPTVASIDADLVLDADATVQATIRATAESDIVLDATATAGVVEPQATLSADLVLDTTATAHSPAQGFAWVAPPEGAEVEDTVQLVTQAMDPRVAAIRYRIGDQIIGIAEPE